MTFRQTNNDAIETRERRRGKSVATLLESTGLFVSRRVGLSEIGHNTGSLTK
jgi:hypothetical protein